MMRLSLVILAVTIGLTLAAPLLTPFDPMQTDTPAQLQPPDSEHLLGTDLLGRDVFSRLLYGGQRTLLFAFLGSLIAVIPGVSLGLLSGWLGGWCDRVLSALLNALLAVPSLVLALVILTLLGRGNIALALAIGVSQVASCAFVTRAAVRSVKTHDYVDAARSLGGSWWQVMLWHIFPNIRPVVLSYGSVVFSYSILNWAALNFLNLGIEPGVPDWGVMLSEGRAAFRAAPWISFAPGLAITLTVWAANSLADQLAAKRP